MSSLVKTVFFTSIFKSNLLFNLTLPTSERSYLVLLKKRLLNRFLEVSTVGGSPGLNTL